MFSRVNLLTSVCLCTLALVVANVGCQGRGSSANNPQASTDDDGRGGDGGGVAGQAGSSSGGAGGLAGANGGATTSGGAGGAAGQSSGGAGGGGVVQNRDGGVADALATSLGDASVGGPKLETLVAVGQAGLRASYARGAANWTQDKLDGESGDNFYQYRDIVFAGGVFCAVGGGFQVSGNPNMGRSSVTVDGVTWQHWSDPGQWLGGVAYGDGWFIAAGGLGRIVRSKDCKTWQDVHPSNGTHLRWIDFKDGVFITNGDSGGFTSSDDGKTWTPGNPAGASRPNHGVAGVATFFGTIGGRDVTVKVDGTTHMQSLGASPAAIAYAPGSP